MVKPESLAQSIVPGAAALRAVERAIGDLRRGEPVLLHGPDGETALVVAAEAARAETLARLTGAGGSGLFLLLTGRRALALGLDPGDGGPEEGSVVALDVMGLDAPALGDLADPARGGRPAGLSPLPAPPALSEAAVDLVKLARLLPAAVLRPLSIGGGVGVGGGGAGAARAWAAARDFLAVGKADIAEFRSAGAGALTRVAEARLPLAGAEDTRVVAFRPGDGGKAHLAIVVGAPKPNDSVLVRVHSECFTGDLLGSLRCDCGDQLRGGIEAIAAAGSGVLLYLSQEGRGIGLVNKLRAYQVQDGGADTAQANEALGFDADERIYLPAAAMLRQLGLGRVRLLTNNPHKVSALARCGIVVEERVPHAFPANSHNDFYLATKAARFGHHF